MAAAAALAEEDFEARTGAAAASILTTFFVARKSRDLAAGRLVLAESLLAASDLAEDSSSDLGGTDMKGAGGPVGLGFQEAISQRIDLFAEKAGGAVIQENEIRQLAFSGQWQLLG